MKAGQGLKSSLATQKLIGNGNFVKAESESGVGNLGKVGVGVGYFTSGSATLVSISVALSTKKLSTLYDLTSLPFSSLS